MALCVTGLGLLGLTILYVIFSGDLVWQYLSGFAGKGFRTCMQSVWLSPPHPLCCRSSSCFGPSSSSRRLQHCLVRQGCR